MPTIKAELRSQVDNAAREFSDDHARSNQEVVYWGDLDVYGLRILSQYRHFVGPARSLFMDLATLRKYGGRAPKRDYRHMEIPSLLQPEEAAAFLECNEQRLQLEQERIPHRDVRIAVSALTWAD